MIPAMIVPVLAAPNLLYRMLDSIDHEIDQLVVIDNGQCVDHGDVVTAARTAERVNTIKLPANLGVAGSWNLGIKATPFAPWWLICNFDVTWPSGSLQAFCDWSNRDTLTLSGGNPPWCAFTLGDRVVQEVGLFDERFHPGYFEDNDYELRCQINGARIVKSAIPVRHDNSSTLATGQYDLANQRSFTSNMDWYNEKRLTGDLSDGWSLRRRRFLSWD